MSKAHWIHGILLPSLLLGPGIPSARADSPSTSSNARARVVMAAQTAPPKLTVEDAVRIGLQRNPQIAAGVAGVNSAAANYRSLAAFPPVQLGVTHSQGTSSSPTLNGQETDTFFDLGETLDTSGQRRFQAAGAKAQLGATRYQLAETRLTLEQQIRDAYWSLAAARAQTAMAQESLNDVQRVHNLTQTQLTAGSAPRQDVVRSGVDVANAQQALVTAQGAEKTALAALNVLLGRPPLSEVVLADTLSDTSPPPDLVPSLVALTDLQRRAQTTRPLILSAQEQVRVADYAVKQARASRFPDVSVDYERSVQQPTGADAVVLGARFPLLDFGSVSQSIRSAEESKRQAQAQLAQTQQQVSQQVAQAYTDYTQAKQLAASYQTDILAPSVQLLNMTQVGYKQGATGILPVIDATTTLRNARTGYINALLALYKARDEVYATTGGL